MNDYSLLLQPVLLIGWALALSAYLCANRLGSHRSWWLWLPPAVTYLLFATPLGANALVSPLERRAMADSRACAATPAQALVVVLTGGLDAGGPGDATERLQQDSFRRLLHGIAMATQSDSATLVLSGGSGGPHTEAEALGTLALRLGMPPDRLIVDAHAANTHDSANSVRILLDKTSARSVILVTSALHAPRALAEFRAAGLPVCLRPTDFRYVPPSWPGYLVPQISALDKSTAATHEYLGLTRFALLRLVQRD